MKKFSEYSKKDKIIRVINYCFSALMVLTSIGLAINAYFSKGMAGATRCIGPVFHIVLIYIIELILRYRVSNFVLTFYNVFVFFAALLGTGFDFYNLPHYDDVMHTTFGYVGCIIGLFVLVKFSDYDKMSTKFVVLMTMFVTMGCAAIWEIMEYGCDIILKTTAQGAPVNGVVPLQDTMMDIIVSFLGMMVFEIQYIIHRVTKKDLMISGIIEDFKNI